MILYQQRFLSQQASILLTSSEMVRSQVVQAPVPQSEQCRVQLSSPLLFVVFDIPVAESLTVFFACDIRRSSSDL